MGQFDDTKDKILAEDKWDKGDGSGLYMGVYQYNGGCPKIGFRRTYMDKNGVETPAKTGRFSRDESSWIEQEITDLIDFMDKLT